MNTSRNSCNSRIATTQSLAQRNAAPRWGGRIWLAVVTAGLLFSVAAQAQYNYTTNNSAITITGYTGADSVLTITNSITGLPVTSLGNKTFQYNTNLTSVTIPNSVTSIGANTFDGCTGLTSVTLGTNVTSIGASAFFSCRSLTNIVFPASVTSIGGNMFYSTHLTSITIPAAVTNIGDRAFSDCPYLTNITVEAQNIAYSSLAGVLFNNSQTTLIQFPGGKAGSSLIPSSVTSIGDWAFYSCRNLTNVTIPSSVASLGANEFYATKLISITIPASVTNIGRTAFYGCQTLTNITVDSNNPAYCSVNGVLYDKNQTTLIQDPEGRSGNVTIPNTVTTIEYLALAYCPLTSVIIPDSVTNIGTDAFFACSSLTNVTIGSGVVSIGPAAFRYCSALTQVSFRGNAPSGGSDSFGFSTETNAIIYFLPGATGFGATFAGLSTSLSTNTPYVILNGTANPANGGVVSGGGIYPIGTNVQITATANTYWQFTGWSDNVANPTRVIAVTEGGGTYTANFSNLDIVTTSAPVITNALLVISNQFVIVVGETNVFNVSAADPVDNSFWYRWDFGDGQTSAWSTATVATHAYPTNNCGPYTASVTVSNTQVAISSNLTVSAACQLGITKLQLGVSFIKTNTDSATLIAKLELPGVTNVIQLTNAAVRVDIGDALVSFTLDNKGRGGSVPRTCRWVYTKPTKTKAGTKAGYWTATIALSKGFWRSPWAAYGLDSASHKSADKYSVTVPVVLLVGGEAFANAKSLHYTTVPNKTGAAK